MSILQMILMASTLISPIQPGESLPPLKGEFLTGRQAQLPDAASGRKDFDSNSQVTFYEIPMIGGMARLGKLFIDSGMRKGTPRSDQENVITVYGSTDTWKQRIGFQAPDAAYLVLLDKHGVVRWRHSGAFDEEAYRDLHAQISALLREP